MTQGNRPPGTLDPVFVTRLHRRLATPLTVIQDFVALLRAGRVGPLTDRQRDILDIVGRNTRYVGDLFADLLDLAHVARGEPLPLIAAPVDLTALLRQVLARAARLLRARGLLVALRTEPGLRVAGDRERLARALGHLFHNAVRHSPPDGKITVRSRRRAGKACITFLDQGPGPGDLSGAPPSALPTTGRRLRLGLPTARAVVEAHGGELALLPGPGGGALWGVRLPLLDDDGAAPDPGARAAAGTITPARGCAPPPASRSSPVPAEAPCR